MDHIMLPEHEDHLLGLKRRYVALMDAKYRKGQVEHGGRLWEKAPLELLHEALKENIDQGIYLLSAIERMEGNHK